MSSFGNPIVAGIVAAAFVVAVSGATMAGPRCGSNPNTASTSTVTADSGSETAAPQSKTNTGG